ncbi:MAG TPA: ATP-dependent helicase, partial [Anaerolineales bacterium]|nr:ATP-dependent helicase [Anaerolineales bacterium]
MATLSLKKLWSEAGFKPNEEQQAAIEHVDGPLYLTAGPGSGKTRVLLWRTVNLMVFQGVKPEEIYLSTFTEKAAHQLKEGLRTLLGMVTNHTGLPYDLTPMYIGTVHSLCQRVLSDRRHFVVDRHRNRPPQLLDELSQYFHLSRNRNWKGILEASLLDEEAHQTINAIWERPSLSKHTAVVNCTSIFNRFSEECIDVEAAKKLARKSKKHFGEFDLTAEQVELLLDLYAGYKNSLQLEHARLTDFALLQQEAFNLLEANEGSKHVFKHVIVDEYQDTNSIQERIFFRLAAGTKCICVVGDDDQALYRFRGATVENFVDFDERCRDYLGKKPRRLSLDINYRSRKQIVEFYKTFMTQTDWKKPEGGHYRITSKNIQAHRSDEKVSVVASTPNKPEIACAEIANLVKALLDEGRVKDPNQIAFLFPSFKYRGEMVSSVKKMKSALEAVGLQVYAPRAGRFVEVDESLDVFGLLLHILGRPPRGEFHGGDYDGFQDWAVKAETRAKALMMKDALLKRYVDDIRQELEQASTDYEALLKAVGKARWDLDAPYQRDKMKRVLSSAQGLSERAKKLLSSAYLDRFAVERETTGDPLTLLYILRRVTSIDWNLLDIFYRLCGFEHFKHMLDMAEDNED